MRGVEMFLLEIPRHSFAAFLKSARLSTDPNVEALGPYERVPARRGRRVTQEELAEAIGSSRVWLSMLESGATLRPSPQLLDRLARARNRWLSMSHLAIRV